MEKAEVKNAKITGTMLGYEDHGILSCFLYLQYEHSNQGFGGHSLDKPMFIDGKFSHREGTAYGMIYIGRILNIVGVNKWEDLKGQYIRVMASNSKVHKIGHYLKDVWFDPCAIAKDK